MRHNEKLQLDVLEAIKWEPLLHAAEIGVTAQEGIITLTGTVDSFAKKMEAEHAARTVIGVRAVVEKIEVVFGADGKKTDLELAAEILKSIRLNPEIPQDKIFIKVENSWVTIEGELKWYTQKEAVQKSVEALSGIRNLTNNIQVKSETADDVEKVAIENALVRNWAIDDHHILVNVFGNRVTLSGKVKSIYQKDEAERIAWNAPGVWNVHNELLIDHATI
ncbi:BON domain-containing protein [Pedobacter fastidiosus]|uniref:BON domain-containing protein n=1 Tax=Pedobacter fastidiosus TaxID=2765361 RepID=A0ABR7KSE3_9SPHI|nr:BON domain-containing protein [Pedobacter fastidiosus]MBC6110941.1 BON domain-containing protein [Pedobacter fastidiosus]